MSVDTAEYQADYPAPLIRPGFDVALRPTDKPTRSPNPGESLGERVGLSYRQIAGERMEEE